MSPSVRDNTKYCCENCGSIQDIPFNQLLFPPDCLSCGHKQWAGLTITAVCDFCSNPVGRGWRYPCRDFVTVKLPGAGIREHRSRGDWFACEPCHQLIAKADLDALAVRSIMEHPERKYDDMDDELQALLVVANRVLYRRFAENRIGDPVVEEAA